VPLKMLKFVATKSPLNSWPKVGHPIQESKLKYGLVNTVMNKSHVI
jgi:hypothetical protein